MLRIVTDNPRGSVASEKIRGSCCPNVDCDDLERIVNGKEGASPIIIESQVGAPTTLDAGLSRDPDGQRLSYQWFHYAEAGFVPGRNLAEVTISQGATARAIVTATAACRPNWMPANRPCATGVAHIILAVTDNGTPALTSYRRVILNVTATRNSAQ